MSLIDDCSFLPLSRNVCAKSLLFVSVSFCTLLLHLNVAVSADNEGGILPASPPNQPSSSVQFEYKLENRPDPFVPFITERATASTVDMDEIVDAGEPLTGMQLFEPGQLTLVALIKKGGENLAMVQDFTGKGYVLSEGTKVGRRGVVKNFTPQSVVIEETAVTRAGKKTVTEVVMLLKKEKKEGEK
ncbi:MAG: pilus assembly protein PilP [Desulforhopalus sp.]|nr:pilus assembly protein PilP [Desulforhopalus sp.]